MFSFLRKKYHAPIAQQMEELRAEPIGLLALIGEDCDEIANGRGQFGRSYNNPIPVNGVTGTCKYLGKLLSPRGNTVFFHKLGSVRNETCEYPVDAYEVADVTGGYWDILFFDLYHPRRSNKSPLGYRLKPYDKNIGDIPPFYGVNIYCADFPVNLRDVMERRANPPTCARRQHQLRIDDAFGRTELQQLRLSDLRKELEFIEEPVLELWR